MLCALNSTTEATLLNDLCLIPLLKKAQCFVQLSEASQLVSAAWPITYNAVSKRPSLQDNAYHIKCPQTAPTEIMTTLPQHWLSKLNQVHVLAREAIMK